jgi:hypothetical protein
VSDAFSAIAVRAISMAKWLEVDLEHERGTIQVRAAMERSLVADPLETAPCWSAEMNELCADYARAAAGAETVPPA